MSELRSNFWTVRFLKLNLNLFLVFRTNLVTHSLTAALDEPSTLDKLLISVKVDVCAVKNS